MPMRKSQRPWGDYIDQTDIVPEGVLRPILEQDANQCIKEASIKGAEILYVFNEPYNSFDPETGEPIKGYYSAWLIAISA